MSKIKIWAVLLWLAIWQATSMWVGQRVLLPLPIDVLRALAGLLADKMFYYDVLMTIGRISMGFCLAFFFSVVCAALSAKFRRFREWISPLIFTIKTIPVASLIILILIWVSSRKMTILIAFFMGFPILYTAIYTGIVNCDRKLLEVATVFRVRLTDKIRYVYIGQILPHMISGMSVAIGLCWKAGVAAEIIGLPKHSIGEHLHMAKLYFETEILFAWTIVIISLSILFEKILIRLIRKVWQKMES